MNNELNHVNEWFKQGNLLGLKQTNFLLSQIK